MSPAEGLHFSALVNISRASNHKAQLAAERGVAGKPTKMHYVRVIQSDWCICIPECKLLT